MKELYTKPVSEVNEFSQTADVITTSGRAMPCVDSISRQISGPDRK